MRKFLLGFATGIIALLLTAFSYVRFGFIDREPGTRSVGCQQLLKEAMRPIAKRGTIEAMRWKSAFTMLLAVFLLSASSWAAVCDAECMVQRIQPGCHASETTTRGHHVTSMSHTHCAEMRRPESSANASPASWVQATSSCEHSVCRQPDSLVDPAKDTQFDQVQWAIVHQVLVSELGFVPVRYVSEAPPPGIVPSLARLSLALRI